MMLDYTPEQLRNYWEFTTRHEEATDKVVLDGCFDRFLELLALVQGGNATPAALPAKQRSCSVCHQPGHRAVKGKCPHEGAA